MRTRAIMLAIMLAASAATAMAEERVTSFISNIVVSRDGKVRVTETIEVVSEGDRFRKGIRRDIDLAGGKGKLDVETVTRDGESASLQAEDHDGIRRLRIGSEDKPLKRGTHSYEIVYRIDNGITEAGDDDMFFWDVAGAWEVPMDSISVTIKLPTGVRILDIDGFAGTPDRPRDDLRMREQSGALNFSTRSGLATDERLQIKLRLPRDAIGPADEE